MTVDLAILSHSRAYYSTRRLFEAAEAMNGVRPRLIDPVRVAIHSGPAGAWLSDDGQRVAAPQRVIPRIGATLTEWSLAMLDALVAGGARSVVPADSIRCAADKLASQLVLARAGLPTLPTIAVREPFHAADAIAAVGGAPIVIKMPRGTQGKTVLTAADDASALSTLMTLTTLGHLALVQKRLEMPRPRDLRVMVIGGKALAAGWRYAPAGDFRSNVHRGGRMKAHALTDVTRSLAETAAEAVGLNICGVDLIETSAAEHGFAVLEVNASPGLEGIEGATGLDLATPMVASAVAA